MYQLLRNILLWFDAEEVHYFSMKMLSFFCKFSFIKNFLAKKFTSSNGDFSKEVFGIKFPNPVGLAAGFDKNVKYLHDVPYTASLLYLSLYADGDIPEIFLNTSRKAFGSE